MDTTPEEEYEEMELMDGEEVPDDAAETAVGFAFDVPLGISHGTVMKVQAPDKVILQIACPKNVFPGDRMYMSKNLDDGKWGISKVVRNELPKVTVEATGTVQKKTETQLVAELSDPTVQTVVLETSKGSLRLRIAPQWAPKGSQRFLQLVTDRYYSDVPIYRAVPGFLVQFGVKGDAERRGSYEAIKDDYLRGVPIEEGSVCFAASGPNTRTATICIFLAAFEQLGRSPWETPIGKVCPSSMGILRSIFTGYGDMPQCGGAGPDPILLEEKGNAYIREEFPKCDFVNSANWLEG
jgi:cyclophilin family peptidyl-prolyl cis-trans isomerase